MYKTSKQEKEEVVSYNPTAETAHRFVFLYRRMPGSGKLFFNEKSLWQQIGNEEEG
jgi:hypothetical protein